MLFSEKCADPDEKSYYACGNSSRSSLFAKVPLLGETELLSTAKVVVSYMYVIYSNGFIRTLCMLSSVFCPEHFLSLTDLSPSGPARRFAESDLGLNYLYV